MKFVKFAEAKLGITDCSGWYSITASQVHEIGGTLFDTIRGAGFRGFHSSRAQM
jgi:hypothetical protein